MGKLSLEQFSVADEVYITDGDNQLESGGKPSFVVLHIIFDLSET